MLFNTGGIPVALAFGPDGALYVTDEGRRAIVRAAPDGELTDVVTHCGGKRLNGPNDLAFDASGHCYFSDPWTTSPNNPVGGVYGWDRSSGDVHRIDQGMCFPNGVVTRGELLLVAETHCRLVWAYELAGRGRAHSKRRFCELPDIADAPRLPAAAQAELGLDHLCGPDGMAFDEDGHLFVAHFASGAVFVFDEAGTELDRIAVPGRDPTNLCFAGDRLDRLVVTLDDTGEVVLGEVAAVGRRLPFCPSGIDDHPWAAAMPAR